MKLIDWLHQNDMTSAEFGRMVNMSRSGANRIVKGERIPRPKTLVAILHVTSGQVTPSDFFTSEANQ